MSQATRIRAEYEDFLDYISEQGEINLAEYREDYNTWKDIIKDISYYIDNSNHLKFKHLYNIFGFDVDGIIILSPDILPESQYVKMVIKVGDEYIYHSIPKDIEFAKKLKEVVQTELDCKIL